MDLENVNKLVEYIKSLKDFEFSEQIDSYDHMGAVVVDGILQASLKYDTVVKPRIDKLLQKYPKDDTTSKFMNLCKRVGIKEITNWKGERKPNYILGLLTFLHKEGLETVPQLRVWLRDPYNKAKFIQSSSVTAEYFRILTGDETAKPDRHIKAFLMSAGLGAPSDNYNIELITKTAQKMNVRPSILDYSIWAYQAR